MLNFVVATLIYVVPGTPLPISTREGTSVAAHMLTTTEERGNTLNPALINCLRGLIQFADLSWECSLSLQMGKTNSLEKSFISLTDELPGWFHSVPGSGPGLRGSNSAVCVLICLNCLRIGMAEYS